MHISISKGCKMKTNHRLVALFSSLIVLVLVAFSGRGITNTGISNALTSANLIQATAGPAMAAANTPNPLATIEDPDGGLRSSEKRVINGDNLSKNLLERPFTSKEMIYQPDIDILKASIASDERFFYFTLTMKGLDQTTNTLGASYGIEFDRTKTGRGDLLVWVRGLKDAWSSENIKVFSDADKDIGGSNPILADIGFTGDGYEVEVKLEGSKAVYARMVPGTPNALQIAVSRNLLDNASEFLWGGWADKGVNDPGKFDYNDHFSAREAGSPVKADATYPLAGLYSVDNTCRQPFGFSPKAFVPGACQASLEGTSKSCGSPSFCCPMSGCSSPLHCGGGAGPAGAPTAAPANCSPSQSQPVKGECNLNFEAGISCEKGNDILTIKTSGSGFTGSMPDFTCLAIADAITCTGPKKEPGTSISLQLCGPVTPPIASNCRNYPNTFWNEDLKMCLPLGNNCCPIGQEWLTDEGRCADIVTGDGKGTVNSCGDAYTFINGYCVLKSSLGSCCTTITLKAPCCYSSCVQGYILNPVTHCCNKVPSSNSCAGVVCSRCLPTKTCPPGCC
jgi:hypothetical protein